VPQWYWILATNIVPYADCHWIIIGITACLTNVYLFIGLLQETRVTWHVLRAGYVAWMNMDGFMDVCLIQDFNASVWGFLIKKIYIYI